MPSPRKVDLLPDELQRWLREALEARGYADIVEVTEDLNERLEAEGMELRLGKSAVGRYSKVLKDQRQALEMAGAVLEDLDVGREGQMHAALMQMIAVHATKLMATASDTEEIMPAKELASLGKMLKDLMHSSGIREKILADERARIEDRARAQAAEAAEQVANACGLSADTVAGIRHAVLGVPGD